jgi:hypothetical protein
VVVSFLGLNLGLKQAQWTSLIVFIVLLPITYYVLRYVKPIPAGESAATYGIAQKAAKEDTIATTPTVTMAVVTKDTIDTVTMEAVAKKEDLSVKAEEPHKASEEKKAVL